MLPVHRRVLVLSADVGEGHAAAARAMAAALMGTAPESQVRIVNGAETLGPIIRWCVERGYRRQLAHAAATYGLLFTLVLRCPPVRWLARALIVAAGARRMRRLINRHRPDVVISTYPALTVLLGALRRRGHLSIPAVAVISDYTGMALWTDRSVDMHMVNYESTAAEASARIGARRVMQVRPLVDPAFARWRPQAECREMLGVPKAGPLLVVSGGGWAVGNLSAAISAALAVPGAHVLCLAGRDTAAQQLLAERFAEQRRVTVLGFTDRMSDVLGAADALIHTTAGMTCLEALVCGCPIIAFQSPPGHPRRNAQAMARAGLLECAEGTAELQAALERTLSRQRPERPASQDLGDPGAAILALGPIALVRRQHARSAAWIAAAAVLAGTAWEGIGVLGEGDARGPSLIAAAAIMLSAGRSTSRVRRPV